MLEIGSELSVPENVYRHVGAYVGGGYVFDNHPSRGEGITTIQGFAQGRPISITKGGVANILEFNKRLKTAMENPSHYNWFSSNCEQTVSKLRTGVPSSPQVLFWSCAAIGLIAGITLLRSK